jgi:hypothetical protein
MILDISSRSIWESNLDIIRKHNLEADLGLHSYTLGMNKYGDLVGFFIIFRLNFHINMCRPMKNSTNK